MSTEPEPDLAPEIAHVLLMDVVGYSKLLVDDQISLLTTLNQIVRGTAHFVGAEKEGKLTRLPTGDGMALLFTDSPEAPVRCALEISREVRDRSEIKLRMGIHSGPIRAVMDVNDRANVAGAGLDTAQRVLDCGDAGHILLSQRAAEDLRPYRHWNSCLSDLGECAVKHGARLHIFNLCKDGLGNPAVPRRIQQQRGKVLKLRVAATRWAGGSPRRKAALVALCGLAFIVAGGAVWSIWKWMPRPDRTDSAAKSEALSIPEKSIAILPFSNLSDDKQNAYFTEGVQDEILTNLSRIADLKVISRSSVMHYASGVERNLRAIARALGVAYVLEGSVQRVGDRIRVSAQLIDARSETHLWAERYDRELSDVFAIQTEVAEKVAAQLKARLSPQEKAAIAEQPTNDLEAHDLYVRGKAMIADTTFNSRGNEDMVSGARLLEQAIARDPKFFLAFYQLARAHNQIYKDGVDHTATRLDLADAAIQAMLRLRPDAGETHVALGEHLYWGYRDYNRAREELELARRALPNDPRPILLLAYIDRRQGRWEESLRGLHRALEFAPRDLNIFQQISLSYRHLRRFADWAFILDRALAVAPEHVGTRIQRARVALEWRADAEPLRSAIRSIIEKNPTVAPNVAEDWLYLALCERNPVEAERALAVMTTDGCRTEGVLYPRAWCTGLAARARGDGTSAHTAFTAARVVAEKTVREQPAYAEALSILGMIDAALGKNEEAIREGQRAVELLPVSRDSVEGAILLESLAIIYAWTGEKDFAITQLAAAVRMPGKISYGYLRLHPYWDPLRGDPRFDQIVASLAPKD